jgi:hypothetical protein
MVKLLAESPDDFLYDQLIKLGDMMGDGLHHEPDGKWISREYKKICIALGLIKKPNRKNNSKAIDKAMAKSLGSQRCPKCDGNLKQTRAGSLRANCLECGVKFQVLKKKD